MRKITVEEICQITGGYLLGSGNLSAEISSIGSDTKTLTPGSMFVALKGQKHDGHHYLQQAADNGAIAALVDHAPGIKPAGMSLIAVGDTRRAMGWIAHHIRMNLKSAVFAVGGSNGKTGAKHLIDSALRKFKKGTFSPKSFNNDIGVPLAVFAANEFDDYLVLELGTNHKGEIAALTDMVRPDVAIVISCSEEHLEGLGDIDGVRKEEASIIKGIKKDGLLIVNGDDARFLMELNDYAGKVIRFGEKQTNDLFATDIRCDFDGVRFKLNGGMEFFIPLLGKHTAVNSLAAIAAARYMGLTDEQIRESLAEAHGPAMRLQVSRVGQVTLVNDAYNANPASMRSAIETLESLPCEGRKIAVLGDMRELGEHTDSLHQQVGSFVAQHPPDLLICVGEKAQLIAQKACEDGIPPGKIRIYPDTLAAVLDGGLGCPGDLVLFKASRSMEFERIANAWGAPASK